MGGSYLALGEARERPKREAEEVRTRAPGATAEYPSDFLREEQGNRGWHLHELPWQQGESGNVIGLRGSAIASEFGGTSPLLGVNTQS